MCCTTLVRDYSCCASQQKNYQSGSVFSVQMRERHSVRTHASVKQPTSAQLAGKEAARALTIAVWPRCRAKGELCLALCLRKLARFKSTTAGPSSEAKAKSVKLERTRANAVKERRISRRGTGPRERGTRLGASGG